MTPEQKILAALSDKMGGMSSAEIGKASGLWSASLYPALSKLEHDGKLR